MLLDVHHDHDLDALGDVVQLHVAGFRGQLLRDALDDHVARVGHGVHRVAEADHDFLVGDALADVGLGLIGRVVAFLDFQRDFVGAAVFRVRAARRWRR